MSPALFLDASAMGKFQIVACMGDWHVAGLGAKFD